MGLIHDLWIQKIRQGKGIFLIRDVEKVPVDFSSTFVAQRCLDELVIS